MAGDADFRAALVNIANGPSDTSAVALDVMLSEMGARGERVALRGGHRQLAHLQGQGRCVAQGLPRSAAMHRRACCVAADLAGDAPLRPQDALRARQERRRRPRPALARRAAQHRCAAVEVAAAASAASSAAAAAASPPPNATDASPPPTASRSRQPSTPSRHATPTPRPPAPHRSEARIVAANHRAAMRLLRATSSVRLGCAKYLQPQTRTRSAPSHDFRRRDEDAPDAPRDRHRRRFASSQHRDGNQLTFEQGCCCYLDRQDGAVSPTGPCASQLLNVPR